MLRPRVATAARVQPFRFRDPKLRLPNAGDRRRGLVGLIPRNEGRKPLGHAELVL